MGCSMAERKHKDVEWTLPVTSSGALVDWMAVQNAILMDLRDNQVAIITELRTLNALFRCHNFLSIPGKIDRIARNTTKRKYKRKAAR